MSKLARSGIELLPDELWLEVFAYVSLLDLYHGWRNLNSHIDAILRSVRISIHIDTKNKDNNHYQNALLYFSLQTVCVKDERADTTTSSLSPPINLRSLANLQSLYLTHCSQEQFGQLINLRQLTRLSLPCNQSSAILERVVFGKEEERFPQLRSIGRVWCDDKKLKGSSSTVINTAIRHIHLIVQSCGSPVNFIQYLPELSSITVDYLANGSGFSSSCFISAKIRRQCDDVLRNTSTKMKSSSQPIDQENLFLITIAPRIYRLQIDFYGNCDFAELARILQRCLILERIQIRIKYYSKNLDLASIRNSSPYFAALTFGDVHKETGKPTIVAKWSA